MINPFEKHLSNIIEECEVSLESDDDIPETQLIDLQTRCVVAIERVVGRNTIYSRQIAEINKYDMEYRLPGQVGVAKALLSDIRNGYLKIFEETVRGELFADYLEMAAHLAENGYKDPAAVVTGSTLEAHLRKLCDKHGVATVLGTGKPKKADTLNADLEKAGVYNKLDQKSVTAWLDIRNKAAHGKYDEYTLEQVKLLINLVRDFISRHPA